MTETHDKKKDLSLELAEINELITEFESEYADDSDFDSQRSGYFVPKPSDEEIKEYNRLVQLRIQKTQFQRKIK